MVTSVGKRENSEKNSHEESNLRPLDSEPQRLYYEV